MKLMLVLITACVPSVVQVQPVKVEPIHVTIDVNVHDAPSTPTVAKPKH